MAANIDYSNENELNKIKRKEQTAQDRADSSGIGNESAVEPRPVYIKAGNQTVYPSLQTNALIAMGNDRPSSILSGHGGEGGTQCATIDIVAGIASPVKTELYADPNMKLDAARIYISQRTDVDNNFELVSGNNGNSKNKSAIAMKADAIRIIAREGIKLVTKTDVHNSAGEKIEEHLGVDIIALNNDNSLQPMVLGENLADCLREIVEQVDQLQNRIQVFIDNQERLNSKIANHTHYGTITSHPVLKLPCVYTLASPQLVVNNLANKVDNFFNVSIGYYGQKVNFAGTINRYLTSGSKFYINSKYNRVN